MTLQAIPHRRGDSFRVTITASVSGLRLDLSQYQVEAALESQHGARLHTFAIPQPGVDGVIVLESPAVQTEGWPVGRAECAIRMTAPSGDRLTSPAFAVDIERGLFE